MCCIFWNALKFNFMKLNYLSRKVLFLVEKSFNDRRRKMSIFSLEKISNRCLWNVSVGAMLHFEILTISFCEKKDHQGAKSRRDSCFSFLISELVYRNWITFPSFHPSAPPSCNIIWATPNPMVMMVTVTMVWVVFLTAYSMMAEFRTQGERSGSHYPPWFNWWGTLLGLCVAAHGSLEDWVPL